MFTRNKGALSFLFVVLFTFFSLYPQVSAQKISENMPTVTPTPTQAVESEATDLGAELQALLEEVGKEQVDCEALIVDDSTPEPCFRIIGQGWTPHNSGYNGGSIYHDGSSFDFVMWFNSSVEGDVEIFITVPTILDKELQETTKYFVRTVDETIELDVDQSANEGQVVSLGVFTLDSTALVAMSARTGSTNPEAVAIADAVSFGEDISMLDLTPPKIEDVKVMAHSGQAIFEAKITDEGSGVASAQVLLNGNLMTMTRAAGGDIYSVTTPVAANQNMSYQIFAVDAAGNEAIWDPTFGYMSRGTLAVNLGFPEWALYGGKYDYLRNSKGSCSAANLCNGGFMGDPVNTANGNLVETQKVFYIPGRPAIDLHITYNSQGGRPGTFGENWTQSYDYALLPMNNAHFQGAFVQYPDGRMVKFTGASYTPEAGYFDKLSYDPDRKVYTLTQKDNTKIEFNALGQLSRLEDLDGNGLNFEYASSQPFTLMSQMSKITADGGRSISLAYNSEGLVSKVTGAEGKEVRFEYENGDLVRIIDGRGGVTGFQYQDHRMTKMTSPKGHRYYENVYDNEGRVVQQTTGASFLNTFAYQQIDGKTVVTVTDANSRKTIFTYDAAGLLLKQKDAAGFETIYEYDTDKKKVIKETDKNNNSTIFRYDENGNVIYEKDALGYETTRRFHPVFNKPLEETLKQADHVSKWQYNETGHVLKFTNAKNFSKEYKYNDFGQLTESFDFNHNKTSYSYTPAGDLDIETDALGKSVNYDYDGLGRMTQKTNKRGFAYGYTYDANDNLTKVTGPLGYMIRYEYDANNNKTKEIDANTHATEYFYDLSENMIRTKNALGFEVHKAYGPMNELLSITDEEGRITRHEYDALYRVKKTTLAAGTAVESVSTMEYDGNGNLVKATDGEGRVTKQEYDKLNRATKKIQNYVAGGSVDAQTNVTTSFEYTPNGVMSKQIDANGNATVYEYDALDQLKKVTDAEGQTTEYTYDQQGNIELVKNPRGFSTEYGYNELNQKVSVTDAEMQTTSFFFDANGNLEFSRDANGVYTRFVYNDLDQKVQQIQNFVNLGTVDSETNVKTTYEYDLVGNLKKQTSPRNFSTTYVYDALNRNTEIRDALSKSVLFEYDRVGNLKKKTDRNGNVLKYDYDALNRVVKTHDQEGYFEVLTYDRVGNLKSKLNKRSKLTTYAYDALNRPVRETNVQNHFKLTSYDAMGNVLSQTDENGHVTYFTYDKVYRQKTVTDAESNLTQYFYDQNGNNTKIIDAENNATLLEYDKVDRLKVKVNAENEREEYAYDKLKNRTMLTEADGTRHKYSYDRLYRLVSVIANFQAGQSSTHDRNVETKYKYDANGNNIEVIDANSNSTKYTYDELDRLTQERNPLANTWNYTYDNETNLTGRTDAKSQVTQYSYYPDYALKKITYPTSTVEYQYNPSNVPTQMLDSLGTTVWSYDDLDRLTSQLDPLAKNLSYEYDPVGNLLKLTYPDQKYASFSYLDNNWLDSAKAHDTAAGSVEEVAFTRNKVGLPSRIERSNDSLTLTSYDKVYRTLATDDHQVDNGNHLIHSFNYTYNDLGLITQEIANYGWRQPQTVTTTYSYDGLHRLTVADADEANSYSRYTYDRVGNRTSQLEEVQQGTEVRSFTYNAGNQLTRIDVNSPQNPDTGIYTFTYDANGNRLQRLLESNGTDEVSDYSYDLENRLREVHNYHLNELGQPLDLEKYPEGATQPNRTTMEYDGNGRRLKKNFYAGNSQNPKTTEYVFDHLEPVAEYDTWSNQRRDYFRTPASQGLSYSMDASQSELLMFQVLTGGNLQDGANYIYEDMFTGETVSEAPPGTLYFYHYDGEGNIGATSKHSAQSDHAYRYDEYGAVLPENGNLSAEVLGTQAGWTAPHNEYTLNQKQIDSYTGLIDFGVRHYDPYTGTWVSQDTYRGDFSAPASLHRYQYNFNSPMNYQDEWGYVASVITDTQVCTVLKDNSLAGYSSYCYPREQNPQYWFNSDMTVGTNLSIPEEAAYIADNNINATSFSRSSAIQYHSTLTGNNPNNPFKNPFVSFADKNILTSTVAGSPANIFRGLDQQRYVPSGLSSSSKTDIQWCGTGFCSPSNYKEQIDTVFTTGMIQDKGEWNTFAGVFGTGLDIATMYELSSYVGKYINKSCRLYSTQDEIIKYLGEGAYPRPTAKGNYQLISKDGTRVVRFDMQGYTRPHVNVEYKVLDEFGRPIKSLSTNEHIYFD